ncbi:Ppx/GppA phosphatase family protein [Entomobacter blattae]|uniref:Guanosine-5'-triphosphate,3'-diphosphate pyrophosphatase n=1 Tax=Entomobacter blattae TaxID=2762277 RepID=A0A7H1NSC5_9PROT|nr:Ppx/GppA phosphatase family protein [Entomobacter blattae]QNT78685.1 Guanosine-5'-triphosphate,3'-diphosphate pyrophosphatase [Entomobacter blattae]
MKRSRTRLLNEPSSSDLFPAAALNLSAAEKGDSIYAAIDLGTNNCRMMVAMPSRLGFRVVDNFTRIVRLGEGLHTSGMLSSEAMERTLDALQVCAERLQGHSLQNMRAVATEACRRAANGKSFLKRVRKETGLDIDIISSREEVELALESCAYFLHGSAYGGTSSRALLFDIGGGSTEIAWIRMDSNKNRQSLIGYISIPKGVVTLSEQYGDAIFTQSGYAAMVDEITHYLEEFEDVHCIGREISKRNVRLLGTSGTVTTLASIALGLERYNRAAIDGSLLACERAIGVIRTLVGLGFSGLKKHPGIGVDRADYILPGCAIFEAIVRTWSIKNVIIADRGLRDGLLSQMMKPARRPNYYRTPGYKERSKSRKII